MPISYDQTSIRILRQLRRPKINVLTNNPLLYREVQNAAVNTTDI